MNRATIIVDGITYALAVDDDDPAIVLHVAVNAEIVRVLRKPVAVPLAFSSTTPWSPSHGARRDAIDSVPGSGGVDDLLAFLEAKARREGHAPPAAATPPERWADGGFDVDAVEEG